MSRPTISTFAVLTCDRPKALERSLRSYLTHFKENSRQIQCAVFDDSRTQEIRAQNISVLEQLSREFQTGFSYAGEEEKNQFLTKLEKASGVPLHLLKFGFTNSTSLKEITPGANRNSLLLQTVGECFFSVDDDTVCELYAEKQNTDKNLVVLSQDDPTWPHLHESGEDLNKYKLTKEILNSGFDLLAQHELLLGRKISDCLKEPAFQNHTTQELRKPFFERVRNDGAKVRGSWSGIAGDHGFKNSWFTLWLRDDSRLSFLSSEESYLAKIKSRQVLRVPHDYMVSDGLYFQTTAVGLDNREALPPTIPFGRGEDYVFGSIMRKCAQNCFAYLPFAIAHRPLESRVSSRGELNRVPYGLSMFTHSLFQITDMSRSPTSSELQTKQLADSLSIVSNAPLEDFHDAIKNMMDNWVDGVEKFCLNFLDKHKGQPSYWGQDVKKTLEFLESWDQDPFYSIPLEFHKGSSFHDALLMTQRFAQDYVQLLFSWNQIIEAAKVLKKNGVTIASRRVGN